MEWEGIQQLKRDLLNLPDQLRDDAQVVVEQAARRAEQTIRQKYEAVRTKKVKTQRKRAVHLADGVKLDLRSVSQSQARAVVRSTAYHAHLYEYGTVHSRPHPTLVPAAERERAQMFTKLVQVVEQSGLVVTGA